MNELMIFAIDQSLGFFKQVEFLSYLLPETAEIFLMRLTDIGKNTYIRPDDVFQSLHLIGFGDASFKHSQFMIPCHIPNRQRNPYLGIITLRAANHIVLFI